MVAFVESAAVMGAAPAEMDAYLAVHIIASYDPAAMWHTID